MKFCSYFSGKRAFSTHFFWYAPAEANCDGCAMLIVIQLQKYDLSRIAFELAFMSLKYANASVVVLVMVAMA